MRIHSDDCLCCNNCVYFSTFEGISSSHCSENFPALKLLYVVATETGSAPWSRDQGVEPLPLSRGECLWLRLLLCRSNVSLPPGQRCGQSFWKVSCGYAVQTSILSQCLNLHPPRLAISASNDSVNRYFPSLAPAVTDF